MIIEAIENLLKNITVDNEKDHLDLKRDIIENVKNLEAYCNLTVDTAINLRNEERERVKRWKIRFFALLTLCATSVAVLYSYPTILNTFGF